MSEKHGAEDDDDDKLGGKSCGPAAIDVRDSGNWIFLESKLRYVLGTQLNWCMSASSVVWIRRWRWVC
jgi:hypothetical protein